MNKNLIHPKEKNYYTLMVIISIIIYISMIPFIFISFFLLPILLILVFISWAASQIYKAQLFSNNIEVNNEQYSSIYNIALKHSEQLNIKLPKIFISNSNGEINAIAKRVYLSKYIILNSSLVDLYLLRNSVEELEMIIGHEIGHHAANHLSISKKFLTYPAMFIPFIGAAYNRACELTADRIGYFLSENKTKAINALLAITHGTVSLANNTNLDAFLNQQNNISEIAAFFNKLYATHPAMTVRIKELNNISDVNKYKQEFIQTAMKINQLASDKLTCIKCNNQYGYNDLFCENCGTSLKK